MADFVARLAERAVGTAPVVQPLIASVFAPEPPTRWMESELEGEPAPAPEDPHEMPYHGSRETPRVPDVPRLVPDYTEGSSTRGLLSRPEDRDATHDIQHPSLRVPGPEDPDPLDSRSESGHEARKVSSTVPEHVGGAPETGPRLSRSSESEREAAPEGRPQNTSRAVADGPLLPTEHRLQAPHRVEPAPAPRRVEKVPQRPVPEGSPLDMFAAEGETNRARLRSSTAFVERGQDPTAASTPPSGTEDRFKSDESTPGSDTALVHRAAPTAPAIVPRIVHQPDQRQERDPHQSRDLAPEPPAPTIRVAIGRIEVRAITPPPALPTRQQTSARPGPLLSLDDYLKQRNGGQP